MLKKEITYEDYNGNTLTETFYFNINKIELMRMEAGRQGGLQGSLVRMIEAKDMQKILDEFETWILMAYGVKSEDGKEFIKSEALRNKFAQSAAYDALFTEFTLNEDRLAAFINGVVPKDLDKIAKELEARGKITPAELQNVQTALLPPPKD